MKKTTLRILAATLMIVMMLSVAVSAHAADWDGKITIVQSSDIINWDPCASTDTNTKNFLPYLKQGINLDAREYNVMVNVRHALSLGAGDILPLDIKRLYLFPKPSQKL